MGTLLISLILFYSNFGRINTEAAPYFRVEEQLSPFVSESEDSNVELKCPVYGEPTPLIQWSINAVSLHNLPPSKKRLLLDGGRVLRIYRLNHDLNSGLYQCNASNYYGHISTSVYLNVQAFAPRFKMPINRVWKVIRHSNVDFNCDVEAAPDARVHWVDANDQQIATVPGKIETFPNNTMRIYEVNNADEGYYYCNVSNKYGINRSMNKLEVYSFTYFNEVPTPKRSVVNAADSVEFRCKAVSDSRISIDYLWTLNGKPLNITSTLTNDGVSVLKLENLKGRASGKIECIAVTDVDVKSSSVELIVRDIPEAPQLMKIDCAYKAQHRALIVWRKSSNIGSTISYYSIETTTGFRPNIWQVAYEERNVDRDLFKLILPLSPWVNYTFRIIAHNIYGFSQPTVSELNICCTPMDVPHKNPEDVRVFGNEPGNLVIQWKPMDKHDWNAPKLRYLIRYRLSDDNTGSVLMTPAVYKKKLMINNENKQVEVFVQSLKQRKADEIENKSNKLLLTNSPIKTKWNEFMVEDPLVNETIVRDLHIFAKYEVQVRAVNSEGYSAVSPQIYYGYSGEEMPEVAPKNLHLLEYKNYSTVRLAWDSVPEETLHGQFKGYKVMYWLSERPHFTDYILVDNKTLKAEIGGLEALKNYSSQIFVLNSQYSSPPSNLLQFSTPEGPPSKVHNMRAHAVGARSIYVTWESPLRLNGKIRGYFIAFENITSGFVEETYVLHRQLYYLHESLEPNSPYKVIVWAETNGGEGPKVTRLVRTWPLRDPDPPVFTIRSSSAHSINVEWHPARNTIMGGNTSQWQFPGTTFYVKYRRIGKEWLSSEVITLPFTTLELVDLSDNADYEFVGIAREGGSNGRSTESIPMSFRTESQRRLSPINMERLRNAAWFVATLVSLAAALLIIALLCCIAQHNHSGFYEIRIRDRCFRRYENIRNSSSVGGGSVRSGSSSTGTMVAFLDDTSEEHKRFLQSSYNKLLSPASAKKRMAAAVKKKEIESIIQTTESVPLPQKIDPTTRIASFSTFQSNTSNIAPKFRNGNQRRVQLPSPVIEGDELITSQNNSSISSPTYISSNVLPSEYNDASTMRVGGQPIPFTASRRFSEK